MKKLLLIAACLLSVAGSALAQGTITWNNRIVPSVDWRVADANGVFLGANYTAQLWVNGAATTISSAFRTGSAAGYFTSLGDQTVAGHAAGSTVNIQIRAWNNAGGTITSWDSATERGQSATIAVTLGGAGLPPSVPANLSGFGTGGVTAFQLVPEPSTYALGALGIGALLMARRRKV